MDLAALTVILTLVIAWLTRNDWVYPVLLRLFYFIAKLNPFNSLNKKLLNLAASLAMLKARVEVVEAWSSRALLVTDSKGELLWGNEAYLDLIGARLQNVAGFNWSNLIEQEDRKEVVDSWAEAVNHTSDWMYTFRFWSFKSSKVVWVRGQCSVVRNPLNKEVAGWVCTIIPTDPPTPKNTYDSSYFHPPYND